MVFFACPKKCCLSEGVAQGRTSVPQDQASTYRHSAPLRLLPFAVHVIPMAIIQFMDFASDVLVIIQLHIYDGSPFTGAWVVGIVAICLSVMSSWIMIF